MKTILIITANDSDYKLTQLAREGKDIQFLLNIAPRKNYTVVLIPETTTDDIIRELKVPNREVEVLHYAGHANSETLRLNDTNAKAQALAEKLKLLRSLKLIFINGCASKDQVYFFHKADIPFVVATERPIEDTKAAWVATQFYQYLSLGRSVREAFDEVVIDADLGNKNISFGGKRGIIRDFEEVTEIFNWGLYIREGHENSNYTLPFSAKMVLDMAEVNHTIFLDELLYTLSEVESPIFDNIRQLTNNLKASTENSTKIAELLKALTSTIGERLRKITAAPQNKDSEYYRELLYSYAFLFETLLHHSAALLIAEIWQNKEKTVAHKTTDFSKINAFWSQNLLWQSPLAYKEHIFNLLDWLKAAELSSPFSPDDTERMVTYLNSKAFEDAASFFNQQKQLYQQRVRLKEDESLENCVFCQEHLIHAFKALRHLMAFVMASVKEINIDNLRHLPTEIDNVVAKLVHNETNQMSIPSDRDKMLENKSILGFMAKTTNLNDILKVETTTSLFPFIIDRNVFTGKLNTAVALYLFIGYFDTEGGNAPKFHFVSVQNTNLIWQFDEKERHNSLSHIGQTKELVHQENHLKVNMREFRRYITEFKKLFLNP